MDDQDRNIGQPGQGDDAISRFTFSNAGMAYRVISRLDVTALDQALAQPLDHVVVLGVDQHEGAVAPGDRRTSRI